MVSFMQKFSKFVALCLLLAAPLLMHRKRKAH